MSSAPFGDLSKEFPDTALQSGDTSRAAQISVRYNALIKDRGAAGMWYAERNMMLQERVSEHHCNRSHGKATCYLERRSVAIDDHLFLYSL
jgi:hypothetical protein